MIDFRYHLVSIASVFLALAVGIVLGAGPLKGTLGDTLASEVAQLRSDADSLRGELAAAEDAVSARDEVLTTLRPRSTSGLLTGSSVSILALPGSPDAAVEAARGALADSGATIAAEVRVDASWTSQDPPEVTDRTAAAADLRELLAGDLPVGIAPERVIALALGWALAADPTADLAEQSAEAAPASPTDLPTDPATEPEDGTADPTERAAGGGTSARIIEILAEYGLLTIVGDEVPALTDAVVIVTPSTADEGTSSVTEWSDLAGAIDEAGSVIVAGDLSGEPDAEVDLIEAIRASGALSDRISTVDHLATPVGRVALPFVVVEQLSGRAGHYGALGTAAQIFPPLPPDDAS